MTYRPINTMTTPEGLVDSINLSMPVDVDSESESKHDAYQHLADGNLCPPSGVTTSGFTSINFTSWAYAIHKTKRRRSAAPTSLSNEWKTML